MRPFLFPLSILFLFSIAFPAGAQVDFPDFSDTTGLTINGVAVTTPSTEGVVLRLTPAADWQVGTVFTTEKISVGSFSTEFAFRLSSPEVFNYSCNIDGGGDGITFAIQGLADTTVGGTGSGLGIGGVTPSLAVEFDSWCNDPDLFPGSNDPNQSHVGIDLNGSLSSLLIRNIFPDLNAGDGLWFVWIDYDGNFLNVQVSEDNTRPYTPLLTYEVDLESVVGPSAYVGFTGATGDVHQIQDILYWQLGEYTPPPPPSMDIPVLSSRGMLLFVLLLLGAGTIIILGRKQKESR